MAGTGVRLFLSGDTAYAADINTYLMDQVVARFATTAARDAAFGDGIPVSQGGSGKPALSEGRICYIDDLNLIQYYNGASWQDSAQFTVGDGAITTQKLAANSVTSDKIAPGTVIAADIAAGTITATELADGAVTSGKILDGTIVNGDINASAAIAHSKLANATTGQVLLGTTTTGVVTATTVTGDVTITGAGVTAIASGVIVDTDINASAAIDKTKISGTAITAGDTGTVTSTMIADGTIVNGDINASAGIALSKLATSTAGNIIVYNASGVPTAVAETGDISISDTGVTAIATGVIVDADINASAAIAYSKLSLSGSITTTDLAIGAARSGFRSAGAGTAVTLTSNNYNILVADLGKLIEVGPTSANATVTITSANDANFAIGDRVDVLQTTGTYLVTLQGSGVTINAYDSGLKLQGQWACATLIKRATNTWVAVGNLTT